jgi:hypothetical protein
MPKKRSDDPKPLNFDHDEEDGVSDRLKKPFMTPEEERGDLEEDQFYEEDVESPEERKIRKEEEE